MQSGSPGTLSELNSVDDCQSDERCGPVDFVIPARHYQRSSRRDSAQLAARRDSALTGFALRWAGSPSLIGPVAGDLLLNNCRRSHTSDPEGSRL
jgi:hypothetical protein